MTERYRPIDCALHDELQLRVLRGRDVEVEWTDPTGAARRSVGRVTDVFSRDGAEYLRLAAGRDVRLDRLTRVDGIPFSAGSRC
ncbi:MAG: hypothetical protein KJO11_16715 [Gemmatimonadetes bacterium]|nr:hypothetical protein [Gemmatimonadota bacterium]MBT8404594.1 hypothetical protein [Gemmatimonadota bacterium]NNF39165.1 hypothetical protein [Gemmatimonadota bacterium]NNK64792.1 hypothetical protein [Gemmatimonadota bacterium]